VAAPAPASTSVVVVPETPSRTELRRAEARQAALRAHLSSQLHSPRRKEPGGILAVTATRTASAPLAVKISQPLPAPAPTPAPARPVHRAPTPAARQRDDGRVLAGKRRHAKPHAKPVAPTAAPATGHAVPRVPPEPPPAAPWTPPAEPPAAPLGAPSADASQDDSVPKFRRGNSTGHGKK
jgi:hypothetical protein